MTPYLAIVSARFRMLLQYRAAAIAGVWTQIFFGFVLIMVYEAFYRSSTARPMPFPQIVTYVWLGQALLAMLPWNADGELRLMIRNGAVAYELCRPVDLYGLWFARACALRTAPTVLRAIPLAIFAMVLLPLIGLPEWQMQLPSLASFAAFVMTLVFALALAAAITTLINITLLWTIAGDGIVMVVTTLVSFCSGILVPLPLLPDWLARFLRWLPFAGVADLPYRVYIGDVHDLAYMLARQTVWILALVAFGRWLLARGMRRLVVQGG